MQVCNCNVHTNVLAVDGLSRLTMVSHEAKEEVPGKGQMVCM